MVNKTQFYKTKVALAVVLSLGLAACGGGDDSTATSNSNASTDATQNTVGNQTNLTGTVTGVVLDTNGNPVVGAAVFLAGAETITDAGGVYVFTSVPVVNVAGVNNEGNETNDTVGTPLVITIAAAGHMGATVTVSPEAQVDNTGGQAGTGNSQGGNSHVTVQTYIDGFTAQAGTAQLPAISKRVYGYLRDCATNAPLVGGTVAFDFKTANAAATGSSPANDIAPGTSTVNNAAGNYSVDTDANGMFDIMLPADSTLTFLVNGFLSADTDADDFDGTDPGDDVDTSDEQIDLFLGTAEVCSVEFEAEATIPMIKSIDGQIGTSEVAADADGYSTLTTFGDHDGDDAAASPTPHEDYDIAFPYAALNQGVVNDFVINFTEEMNSAFDLTESRVKVDGDTIADATVTLSTDGMSATVTFVTDLPEGSKVDVWFPQWTATDADDGEFIVDNSSIGYDAVAFATTTKAIYTHAFFCTFAKPENGASITLGPQIFDADTTEDGNSTDLAGYSTAFQDNFEQAAGSAITQLNDGDADSSDRLEALAAARGETTITIDQDYAVVSFDATNAAGYETKWTDEDGTEITTAITVDGTAPAATTFHLDGAAHNDVLTVTPVNGFGDVITSGAMSVTLVDAIAPTTVLQESYNITDPDVDTGLPVEPAPRANQDVVDGTTANASFGNGGEVSAPGTTATAAGEPIIHIQPRHLAGLTTATTGRNTELNSLTADMAARLTAAEVTALGGTVDALAAISTVTTTTGSFEMPIYDATAYANWAAVPATIGVAFNENVTLTTTAPAFDGSTTVDGYAALNNVAVNVDGQPSVVDLVTFDTPSVVALSLDAGADLGFVGSVTDSRDNVSTANAQVFIQDTFPPMMTAAIWNGETLTLTFNEEPVINPLVTASINVIDPRDTDDFVNIVVTEGTTGNTVIAGNVMTITLTGPENVASAGFFTAGNDNEFAYNDDASTTNNLPEGEQHALIDWDNIADATGNQWSEFTPHLSASARGMESTPLATDVRRWEVVAPRFLAVDAVGVFSYSVTTNGYFDLEAQAPTNAPDGDDDGSVTYTISFTHPIDVSSTLNAFSTHINDHPSYSTDTLRLGAITANTADANGVNLLNDLFTVSIDGVSTDAFVSNVTSPTAVLVNGSFALSADHKVITLTVQGSTVDADSILFGATEFGFAEQVTSAITGSLTTSGNFNWQDNN